MVAETARIEFLIELVARWFNTAWLGIVSTDASSFWLLELRITFWSIMGKLGGDGAPSAYPLLGSSS